MAMGKREGVRQEDLFITHDRLPKSPGHVFYNKLNQLLAGAGFDRWAALSASLNIMASEAMRLPLPLVRRWRRRIVAKVDRSDWSCASAAMFGGEVVERQ
jgi:transposase